MARADAGRRAHSLLVAVVLGHVLLISAQVATPDGPSLLRTTAVVVVTEFQEASWVVAGAIQSIWEGYAALRGVHEENVRLTGETTALRVQLQQARAEAAAAAQLRALLELGPRLPWRTTGAQVVAGSLSPDYRAMTIDKGLRDGVSRDMPVMSAAGVLGRVALPAADTATVQLIIDRSAAVAVRTERTRSEGIALGNGDDTLRLEYLSATADLAEGDTVVTAGIDGVYPPGLAVGRIERVEKSGTAFRRVTIRPFADFSRLETVLVLVAPSPVWAPPLAAPAAKAER
ncbi:MAG: rod shape-determining protein MreC [Vicinamibacterales bacterium]